MANQVYPNEVLENKLNSILDTKVNLSNYIHSDTSLTENAGMTKEIHTYQAVGQVDEVAQGEGNTHSFESSYTTATYTVGTTQARGIYYDEEAMKDPMVVDTIVSGMAEEMTNDFTRKAIAEMKKATQIVECDFGTTTAGYLFDKVVDAVAMFAEDIGDLTILINKAQMAYFRKNLKDELKYSEGFVRTGYIGSVCGVPVVVSNAVPESCAFIVNKEAVTVFLKKVSESEQERDANLRKNTLYLRKVALVALTDATKLVELAKAQSTICAVTTAVKSTKTITCDHGAGCHSLSFTVTRDDEVIMSGVKEPTSSTSTTTTFAIADGVTQNLAAGDKIVAIAYAYGYAPYTSATFTVAS